MRFGRVLTAVAVMGVLGLVLAGCGTESTPVTVNEIEELNLTDDFGGYKATDYPLAFGDPEIENSMTEDGAAPAFASDSIDFDTLDENEGFNFYAVAIRWGQLEGDPTNTTVTDWSGTASLERGHLRLLRLIRFERGQDSIVRPRVGPLEISWVSKTTVHFDGLLFLIADPAYAADPLSPIANSFTFATEPYTETFTVEDLADLDTIITVDDLGNQVAITAHKIERDPCGKGFVEGVWRANNHLGKMGKFFGKWMGDDGSLAGHLRGHWGRRGNGERVFFGQWISLAGVFKGFIRGEWRPDPDQPGNGFFRGQIFTRNKTELGVLRGQYVIKRDGRAGGFFKGGWKIDCPDEDPDL